VFKLRGIINGKTNPTLMYITSTLIGLVEGIVTTAFGIKTKEIKGSSVSNVINTGKTKIERIGEFAMNVTNNKLKGTLGNLYAWVHILIGISSLVIWAILNTDATQSITNTGTTFIGMMLAIVGAFFKE